MPAARVVLQAFDHGKHVVLVNAELDSLLGPILKTKADQAGVVLTHTDGDEPGVAMTLLRYLRSLGLRPWPPATSRAWSTTTGTPTRSAPSPRRTIRTPKKVTSFADATKLSMETTVLANATGFQVGRRGMYGPACGHVREMAQLLPADQMLATGLVDYALGAAPHTGAFVDRPRGSPLKQVQLAYYKMGDGPFYVFYTPYHLPHIQIASTIGRAAIHRDATVAPLAGPVCEVVTVAKRDLQSRRTPRRHRRVLRLRPDRQRRGGARRDRAADRPVGGLRAAPRRREGPACCRSRRGTSRAGIRRARSLE